MDDYLKELDESLEYPEDDYVMNELMNELDGIIDEEDMTDVLNVQNSLPSVPTHEVEIPTKQNSDTKQKEKVAICEE